MNRKVFGDYIDEICHKCCHNKKNCIELHQAGFLPVIVNNIVEYSYCKNKCHKCELREGDKELVLHWIKRQEHLNRNIKGDLYLFIEIYSNYYPPIEYIRELFF